METRANYIAVGLFTLASLWCGLSGLTCQAFDSLNLLVNKRPEYGLLLLRRSIRGAEGGFGSLADVATLFQPRELLLAV